MTPNQAPIELINENISFSSNCITGITKSTASLSLESESSNSTLTVTNDSVKNDSTQFAGSTIARFDSLSDEIIKFSLKPFFDIETLIRQFRAIDSRCLKLSVAFIEKEIDRQFPGIRGAKKKYKERQIARNEAIFPRFPWLTEDASKIDETLKMVEIGAILDHVWYYQLFDGSEMKCVEIPFDATSSIVSRERATSVYKLMRGTLSTLQVEKSNIYSWKEYYRFIDVMVAVFEKSQNCERVLKSRKLRQARISRFIAYDNKITKR